MAVLSYTLRGGLSQNRHCCPATTFLQSTRLLTIITPFRLRHVILKERRASYGKINCSYAEERHEDNKERKEIDKLQFFQDTPKKRSTFLLQCIENVSNELSQPLHLVKDTVRSTILACLVGILVFMDFTEHFRLQQIPNKSFTSSYTFLFLSSAVVTALLGCMCIPFLRKLKAYQILRKEGPCTHVSKAGTPTMGGFYFIPAGVILATIAAHTASAQMRGLVVVTLVFGAIGLLDDILGLVKKHNYGLPWWCKLSLEVIAGIGFFYWHQSACLPTSVQS